jgi:hypothetical protein
MTYTFKLSRRLALSHVATAAAVVLSTACGDAESLQPAVPDQSSVADVVVAPKQSTVPIAHPTKFTAWGLTPEGDSLLIDDIEWSVDGGGSISQDGVFSASSSGTYQLVGRSRRGKKSDTSTVVVTPAPVLAAVVVLPGDVTLAPGARQAFAASGKMSDGSAAASLAVTWTATGGTIDAAGLYTAGTTAGTYRVVATQQGGTLADTSSVTIAAPAAPPPPAPSTGGHEPSGFAAVLDRRFDATAEGGWSHTNLSPNFTIVSSGYGGAAPKSAANVGRILFPAGFNDGSAPAKSSQESFEGKKKLYVSTWIQVSPNWYGHAVNSKIGYVWTGTKPKVYFNLVGTGHNDLRFRIKTQDMNVSPASGSTNNNLADPVLARGQWHRIEMLLTTNTFGQPDGRIEAWVNGQKVLEQGGFNFNGTTAAATTEGHNTWHKVEWNPIWGGASDVTPTVPETQYMYMDHFYASGQ